MLHPGVVIETGMGVHDPLGDPRGSRRIDQRSKIIIVGLFDHKNISTLINKILEGEHLRGHLVADQNDIFESRGASTAGLDL